MQLPFTQTQFFAIFAAYNEAVWPMQWLLNALALAIALVALRAPLNAGRIVSIGLALLWCWIAFAYHLGFFWSINPVAPFFAAVSLAAAAAFIWFGVIHNLLRFSVGVARRETLGCFLVSFALAGYPVMGAMAGHHYPAAPTFGLPCPVSIFTFGILLMASPPVPRWVLVAPTIWAGIGASAAFSLAVTQDLSLLAMLPIGGYMLFDKSRPPNHGGKEYQ